MKKGNICPLLKKPCIEHQCAWYGQIRGINPNTGQEVDTWQCAVSLLPVLLIENSHKQVQTHAAIDLLRDESVKGVNFQSQVLVNALSSLSQMKPVEEAEVKLLN